MNLNKLQNAPAQSALTPALQKQVDDAMAKFDATKPGSPERATAERELRAVEGELKTVVSDIGADLEFKKSFAAPKKMGAGT